MSLVAGVDCSTQSTKVVVVDADSGEVVATGRAQHTVTGSGGARETHPDVWWEALRGALDQFECDKTPSYFVNNLFTGN